MNRLLTLCVLLPIVTGCVTPSQMVLDAEVKRLCAIDGGIKVYETVKLPADRFDKHGNVGIRSRQISKTTDEFYFDTNDQFLRSGSPTLVRSVVRIVRRNDGKVLGEAIRYGRGGGDIPGPWHPSTFDCPSIRDLKLESAVFIQGVEK